MPTREEIIGVVTHLCGRGYTLHNYDENMLMQKMTKEIDGETHTIRIVWDHTGLCPIFRFDPPPKKENIDAL